MAKTSLSTDEIDFLREAATYLESPSFLMRVADLIGEPIQQIADKIVPDKVVELGNVSLRKAMFLAAGTVSDQQPDSEFLKAYKTAGWTGFWHRVAATATGGVAGLFGLPGLAIELPVTTGIIFRSIASIASDMGENMSSPESRLECLTVFSLGGPSPNDDAMDASYITSRIAMATMVRDASQFMAAKGTQELSELIAKGSAPPLVNLISRIAARFNIVVGEKFVAQALPVISIATGAAINNAFAGHFNSVARYHFGVRKLEREFGQELVQAEYLNQLAAVRPKKLHGNT